MKQYTAQDILKEYKDNDNLGTMELARIRSNVAIASFCFQSNCLKRNGCYNLCSCLDTFQPMVEGFSAFDECPNCFGYGRPPIPPGEVGL